MNTSNLNKTIKVKAFFNHQYRRFSIPIDCEIDELWELFHQVLGIPLEDRKIYQLHYQDEEKEYILFSSSYELKEAIKYFEQQKNSLFRMIITKVDQISNSYPQNYYRNFDPLNGMFVNSTYQTFVNSFPNVKTFSSNQRNTKEPYFLPMTLSSYLYGFILEVKPNVMLLMEKPDVVEWFKGNLKQFIQCSSDLSKYGGTQIETFEVQIQSMIELTKFDEETVKIIEKVAECWQKRIIMIRSQLGSSHLSNFFGGDAFEQLRFLFYSQNSDFLPTHLNPLKKEKKSSNGTTNDYHNKKSFSDRNNFESRSKQNRFLKAENNFFKNNGPKWSRNSFKNSQFQKSSNESGKSNYSLFKNFNHKNSNGIITDILKPLSGVPSIFQPNNTKENNQLEEGHELQNENTNTDQDEELDLSNNFDQQLQISPKQTMGQKNSNIEFNSNSNSNHFLENEFPPIGNSNFLIKKEKAFPKSNESSQYPETQDPNSIL
ncbi:hypothetical protein M0812_12951 [Anaeramoeba flamelloides]|uniref:PB1 domain-containing protein n=1 Tax=Anaeramoeba flamelloides TaxID=1746091 RepID=A0AAV7ZLT5_9EUKA|nr:hypothetical protein M0812_12951 [Anaeramoeba flamelloides]